MSAAAEPEGLPVCPSWCEWEADQEDGSWRHVATVAKTPGLVTVTLEQPWRWTGGDVEAGEAELVIRGTFRGAGRVPSRAAVSLACAQQAVARAAELLTGS